MSCTISRAAVLCSFLVGCSPRAASEATVGHVAGGAAGTGARGNDGTPGAGGSSIHIGDAGSSAPFTAHIERDHAEVQLVTLACGGDCLDVVAVAKGGFPPYSFEWEDGSTSAERRLCPTESTLYRVSVTDTGSTSSEFHRPANTLMAPLAANVLDCPPPMSDAGSRRDAGVADSGLTGPGFCVHNPGFEGPPGSEFVISGGGKCTPVGTLYTPTGWSSCTCSDVLASGGPVALAPFSGTTYLGLSLTQAGGGGSVGTPVCTSLEAEKSYPFSIELAEAAFLTSTAGNRPVVQIWGSTGPVCGSADLLWESPEIENTNVWKKYCGVLRTSDYASSIVFTTAAGPRTAHDTYVVLDDLVPGDEDCR